MKALLQVEISDSESDVTVTSHSLSSSLRPEEANQPSKHWQSESEKQNEDQFSFLKGPHETKVVSEPVAQTDQTDKKGGALIQPIEPKYLVVRSLDITASNFWFG